MSTNEKILNEALKAFRLRFKSTNINGWGWGLKVKNNRLTDKLCLFVTVKKKLPPHLVPADEFIPPVWEGIYTDVIEAGDIRFLQFRSKYRPCPGGVSATNFEETSGTHSLYVFKNGIPYSLSCTHTYAPDGDDDLGKLVLQPAPDDGGTVPEDSYGVVEDYIPLSQSPPGMPAEGAIARVDPEVVSFEILEWGGYERIPADCEVGKKCVKVGRSTGVTHLLIQSCNYQTVIPPRMYFYDVIYLICDDCPHATQPGDSGSVLIRKDINRPVGMVFAGSTVSGVAAKMTNILSLLGVSL